MKEKKRDKNAGFVYWGQLAFLHLLAMIFFSRSLFRKVYGFSAVQSKIILRILVIANFLLGVFFSDKHGKKGQAILLPLLFPYVVYTYFTYSQYFHNSSVILVILMVIVLCFYLAWTWVRPIPEARKRSRVIWARICQSVRYMRNIPALFLCPLIVAAAVVMLQGGTLIVSDIDTVQTPQSKSGAITEIESTDWIGMLNEDNWTKLSTQEKLDLLQLVANYECAVLGVYHDVRVQSGITSKDTVMGTYSASKHVITININHLKNDPPLEAVKTIAHECHHAYAWCLTHMLSDTDNQYKNLDLFADAWQYSEELTHYHDGGDTHEEFEDYYYQAVEEDAREFAESVAERYEAMMDLSAFRNE